DGIRGYMVTGVQTCALPISSRSALMIGMPPPSEPSKATHGTEIFAAAQKNAVMVAFEGSVGGGIPIIKALREGLAANRIEWIAGIINGTSNFILSEMRDKGLDFSAALGEAQRRGYAEADPSFDI